jgi:hypothetical protein
MTTIYGFQWDSVDVLPFSPALQAKYVNGKYAARVQYQRGLVWVDVLGSAPNAARWLDVEPGCADVAQVPGWLEERARHVGAPDGGIYCARDDLAAVELAAGDRPHDLWVATLDGTIDITLPPGSGHLVAVQAFPSSWLPVHADLSIVTDAAYWDAHHA